MSDTPDIDDDDRITAGEYALGLLPEAEAVAFEARLAAEPALRVLYAQWAEEFALLAEDVAPVAPPSRVAGRISARLFPEPRKRGLSERFGLLGWAVAVLAVLLFLSFDGLNFGPGAPTDPVYIADIVAEDATLVVLATYDVDGTLYLEREAGAPRPGRALELWLIAGDAAPVSLGLLPDALRGRLSVEEGLRASLEGGVLAISDEPPGGSPTGAPTGDVLAVGQITNT